jgi:hypothetical protein
MARNLFMPPGDFFRRQWPRTGMGKVIARQDQAI